MIIKTVGRNQDNNIVVNDGKVSRTHLQLVQDDNGNISVVDLGSSNGTFVNGKRIVGETRLKPGDVLRIGDTTLNWQAYFGAPRPVSVPPKTTASPSPQPIEPSKKSSKGKKTWIYFVAAFLLLLIVGGVVLILNNIHKAEINKEQIEEANKLKIEVSNAERDAANAAAEYEKAQKKAAISKSKKDQRIADSLKVVYIKSVQTVNQLKRENAQIKAEKEAAEAKARSEEAAKRAAISKSEKDRRTADSLKAIYNKSVENAKNLKKEIDKINEEKDKALKEKEDAEKAVVNAKEENKNEKERAKKEREEAKNKAKEAEKQIELMKTFYNELEKTRANNQLKIVSEALNISKKSDDDQYKEIVNQFNKSKNNSERQEIINVIKNPKKSLRENKDKTTNTNVTDSSK